jgi:hypothetical protein
VTARAANMLFRRMLMSKSSDSKTVAPLYTLFAKA